MSPSNTEAPNTGPGTLLWAPGLDHSMFLMTALVESGSKGLSGSHVSTLDGSQDPSAQLGVKMVEV